MIPTSNDNMLPKSIEAKVLKNIMVLLVTGNHIENLAIQKYLQPLDGHKDVYQFLKYDFVDQGGQQTNTVIYYIGKYGSCPVAVRNSSPAPDNTNAVPAMAGQWFPNLCAIISVGVACGIKERGIRILDVLVSSKVVNYDKAKTKYGGYLTEEPIAVSHELKQLFTHFDQWPTDEIKKCLIDNGKKMPYVKSGVILSGSYLVNNPAMQKTIDFVPEAIGVEMESTRVFVPSQQTTNTIIIKAVCDFGDGKDNDVYQPTAALVAADFVHKCLSVPQAHEMFESMFI